MEEQKLLKWTIYMYIFPNNKKYIGKTYRTVAERKQGDGFSGYRKTSAVYKAVKHFGKENVKEEVLFEDYMTEEYASRLEMICIALFKTNCCRYKNPSYGYNLTDGGEGHAGYQHTRESKKKMSESKMGQYVGADACHVKPVYCIELGMVFLSAIDAEQYTGVSRQNISLCCTEVNKSTNGGHTGFRVLHWVFDENKTEETIQRIMNEPAVRFSSHPKSGIHGVYWDKNRKNWLVQINRKNVGRFTEKNDAIVARLRAEKEYYGSCAPQAHLFKEYGIE